MLVTYLNLIRKILLFLGFDFDNKYESRPFVAIPLKLWKYVNTVLMAIGMIQLMIFMMNRNQTADSTIDLTTVIMAVIGTQAVIKDMILIKKLDDMTLFLKKVKFFHYSNYGEINKDGARLLKRYFIGSVSSMGLSMAINVLRQIVTLVMLALGHKQHGNVFNYSLYWPIDPYDYLPWSFIYQSLIKDTWLITTIVLDQMTIATTTLLALCYEQLGKEIKQVIARTPENELKVKLGECIDKHVELIAYFNEFNSIYGLQNLVFIVQESTIICVLGYVFIVSINWIIKKTKA
jgi:hypothetical protein